LPELHDSVFSSVVAPKMKSIMTGNMSENVHWSLSGETVM